MVNKFWVHFKCFWTFATSRKSIGYLCCLESHQIRNTWTGFKWGSYWKQNKTTHILSDSGILLWEDNFSKTVLNKEETNVCSWLMRKQTQNKNLRDIAELISNGLMLEQTQCFPLNNAALHCSGGVNIWNEVHMWSNLRENSVTGHFFHKCSCKWYRLTAVNVTDP